MKCHTRIQIFTPKYYLFMLISFNGANRYRRHGLATMPSTARQNVPKNRVWPKIVDFSPTMAGHPAMQEDTEGEEEAPCLPGEAELVLLCLDHLRGLRREYPPAALDSMEGLNADYLTVACWALNRAFVSPDHLAANQNDAYFVGSNNKNRKEPQNRHGIRFPATLDEMEDEILYSENHHIHRKQDENNNDDPSCLYEYDDFLPSNSHRFYQLAGLASGPSLTGALTLGEIAAAGLAGLGARSRLQAEKDMIQSPLFEQFLQAVQHKGFFGGDNDEDDDNLDPQQLYEERYRKVVTKFRNKLATKADAEMVGDLVALSAAEQQKQRRIAAVQQALADEEYHDDSDNNKLPRSPSSPMPQSYVNRNNLFSKLIFGDSNGGGDNKETVVSAVTQQNPVDLEEAEKLKSAGNTHMQRKEYREAAQCYTSALKLCPDGPNSHVYFSNRAAAWVSMKQFQEAILDSERSLALRPDYSKAHARLGLAHFLQGNYRQAMEAYAVALKYEPDNKSSRNYMEKAAKKLAESGEKNRSTTSQSSFSVVSEWEKSASHKHTSSAEDERQQISAEREAEKFKVKGNSYMANRAYEKALDAYSAAIKLCPQASNSHVYYSNRAAALCYLERYTEAEKDSLSALSLNPNYGKAHARLGLSRFFLRDFKGAVEAYSTSLRFDPENAASKSYLAKAKAKLEATSDARQLMQNNPDFRRAAEKAMAASDKKALFDDPEMKLFAERAAADPALMASLSSRK